MPFLSIIVPIYNAEKYLEECLDSIEKQTFQDFELILVNDGSIDRSGEICERYQQQYNNIKVIHKMNGGLVSARKAGVIAAKGLYIGYIDADDFIEKCMYENMCNEAKETNADVVICDIWRWDGKKREAIPQQILGGIYEEESLENEIYSKMLFYDSSYQFGLLPAMWNKIYKAEIIKKNQLLVDERISIGEDVACSYFCILDAKKISYLKGNYYYYYRTNQQSMCQKWENEKIQNSSILLDFLYKRFGTYAYSQLMEQYWIYYSYIYTNMLYEYKEYKIRNRLKSNVLQDFQCIIQSSIMEIFKSKCEKIPMSFTRRLAIICMNDYSWLKEKAWESIVLFKIVYGCIMR